LLISEFLHDPRFTGQNQGAELFIWDEILLKEKEFTPITIGRGGNLLEDRNIERNLSDLFFALGGFLILSLVLNGANLSDVAIFSYFAYPGAVLYDAFLGMSLFFPLYCLGVGLFLRLPKAHWVPFFLLQGTVVPVITLALMLHIISGHSLNLWGMMMVQTFQKGGAIFVLSALLGVEILGMVLGTMVLPKAQWATWFSQAKDFILRNKSNLKVLALPSGENQGTKERGEQSLENISVRDIRQDSFFTGEETPDPTDHLDPIDRMIWGDHPPQKKDQAGELKSVEPERKEPEAEGQDLPNGEMTIDHLQEREIYDWDHLKGSQSQKREEAVYLSPDGEFMDIPLDLDRDWYEEEEREDLDERLGKDLRYSALVDKYFPAEEDEPSFLEQSQDQEVRSLEEDPGTQELTDIFQSPQEAEKKVHISELPKEVPYEPRGVRNHYRGYNVPTRGILEDYGPSENLEIDENTRNKAEILKATLSEFKIDAEVTGIRRGPVITMFEILPAPGVRLSKIAGLSDNIALRLAAKSVRIVAPIPGKHAVGIEVPNADRKIVGFQELIESPEFQKNDMAIPIALGKDISGDIKVIDLAKTPHLLIAGATGAGKSVSVNSLICSILYHCSPHEVKLMLVDPKIVELKFFNGIPHLLTEVITDPKKALQAVQWCLYEMEKRYALLDALGVRDIASYNKKVEGRKLATNKLPYLVFVVDEFADLMAAAGKELEGTLARLAAMSRAVGIHLVLATQRPSIDVITGLIKANFPSRIAFMVASKTDSRIIIDSVGAEKLLGKGDMLFLSSWNPFPSRLQGPFLSEEEVEKVVAHVKSLGEPEYIDDEIFITDDDEDFREDELLDPEADNLYPRAVDIIKQAGKASASFLQRRLGIGYNRAARLIEIMEDQGVVGPQNGSKPREVIGAY